MMSDSWTQVCKSPAFLIGLDKYSFRRDYSKSLLQNAGFQNIEIVSAYPGFENPSQTDKDLASFGINIRERFGYGHRGCNLSHVKIWKQIVEQNIPFAFIFEDDCLPHPDIQKLGQEYWSATPKDFDILYLGNMMNPANKQIYDFSVKVLSCDTYTTHAYMISKKGAEKLLSLLNTMNQIIDMWLYELQVRNWIIYYCWNGVNIPKPYPTFNESLPWQFFPNVLLAQKDTGLFYQNFRLGSTLQEDTITFEVPQYQK